VGEFVAIAAGWHRAAINRCRAANLQFCRDQLATTPEELEAPSPEQETKPAAKPPQTCPVCAKGTLVWLMALPRRSDHAFANQDFLAAVHDPGGGAANAA